MNVAAMSHKQRGIFAALLGAGILAFWSIITASFQVIALHESTEIYSPAPLVRYMSAVGIIAIHYFTWNVSRSEFMPVVFNPRLGLIYTTWMLIILYFLFTATGPIELPPYEYPVNPFTLLHFVTIPMTYFAALLFEGELS